MTPRMIDFGHSLVFHRRGNMQSQTPRLRLTSPQVYIFMGWFIFQEQNDIHSEQTSLSNNEIRFSNKLNAAAEKMKKATKGCYIYITQKEAKIAHIWFNNLPKVFVDKKDRKMYDSLHVFVHENK